MCECACVHPRRSRALLWGRGSRTRRGRRFPKQGASEQVPAALECLQRFVIPGKHPVQLFLAPSGGKQRWLIEATWLQSVPRTKPALGSYASPGNGLQGSPRRQAPSRPQEACPPPPPRSGETHREPAKGAKPGAGAADPQFWSEPPGCGSTAILARSPQPPPRALVFNPGARFPPQSLSDRPGALEAGSIAFGVFFPTHASSPHPLPPPPRPRNYLRN